MSHVFDPAVIHRCAKAGVGLGMDASFDAITSALDRAYPGLINTGPRDWVFSNAGCAMGQIHLLYASLEEYILIFGSPVGTGGHSGRYAADIWDFMIHGEMWCYQEGDYDRVIYRPGDLAFLGTDEVKGYRLPESGWMLEYARGMVPSMLPFGLADTLFSTLDLKCVSKTMKLYTKQVMKSLGARRQRRAIRDAGPRLDHLPAGS